MQTARVYSVDRWAAGAGMRALKEDKHGFVVQVCHGIGGFNARHHVDDGAQPPIIPATLQGDVDVRALGLRGFHDVDVIGHLAHGQAWRFLDQLDWDEGHRLANELGAFLHEHFESKESGGDDQPAEDAGADGFEEARRIGRGLGRVWVGVRRRRTWFHKDLRDSSFGSVDRGERTIHYYV